ncbi:MAG: alkyl hydroperoxide reductase/Thiol specific antioxidant/Mal allergen [Bryobacterales bacterium]|nr:alkyl hydroperoxide reductase/Thiol specific antioxidant/Mal allergen [Bryobacterales bacterium]
MPAEDLQEIVQALETVCTRSGSLLLELCASSPVLLVFLRHAGCTFCREALSDLGRERHKIEAAGTHIVLVHMGDSEAITSLLIKHGLDNIERIRDDQQRLYRAFGLRRGTLAQLFGPRVLWRAFAEGALLRHGLGFQKADGFQMPGVFLIDPQGIVHRFRHRSAADRPDYTGMVLQTATISAE